MNTNKMLGIQDAVFVLEPSLYAMSGQVAGHCCSRPIWDVQVQTPPLASILLSAYLTRGVDYFGRELLPAIFDYFAERVLDGRVVAIDKMPIHKSHCQRRFSWSQADPSLITTLSIMSGRFLTDRSTPYNRHLPLLWGRRHGYLIWTGLVPVRFDGRFQTKGDGKETT